MATKGLIGCDNMDTRQQQYVPGVKWGNATAQGRALARTALALKVLMLSIVLGAAFMLVSRAITWANVTMDDLRYGRPRTFQVDAVVGHEGGTGLPTHFAAINLNRRISIIEMPGGDATKPHTIQGPYLFGDGNDLATVTLRFQDVNKDSRLDMIATVNNEEIVYINDRATGQFRLMEPSERAAAVQALRGPNK